MVAASGSSLTNWPIVADGLLMALIDDVMFVRYEKRLSDQVHKQHVGALAAVIDQCGEHSRRGLVYDMVGFGDCDSKHRAEVAQVLAARRAKVARTTAGCAMVVSSRLVRCAQHAKFRVSPPPYPAVVTATLREGMDFIRRQKPELDVGLVLRRYEALKRRAVAPRPAREIDLPSGPRTSVNR